MSPVLSVKSIVIICEVIVNKVVKSKVIVSEVIISIVLKSSHVETTNGGDFP
jgi:hypothetical protein